MRKIGKKAVVEDMLMQVFKIMFAVLIIIIIIYASYRLAGIFYAEEKSPAENDFTRIAAEIPELEANDEINVPVFAEGYEVRIIDKDNPAKPAECRESACACLYEESTDKPEKCELFSKFLSSKDVDKCAAEKNLCIRNSYVGVNKTRQTVTLTSENYIVRIS